MIRITKMESWRTFSADIEDANEASRLQKNIANTSLYLLLLKKIH